jgi:hypothetical protein
MKRFTMALLALVLTLGVAQSSAAVRVVFMGDSITRLFGSNRPKFFSENEFSCKGADGQTTEVVTNGVNGDAIITVVADDNTTTQTYTIHFTVDKSQVNTLLDIQLDGVTLDGFAPEVNEYNVVLPMGTTSLPAITYTKGIESQNVQVIVEGVNKATKLNVVAENGALNTYTINFSVEKSSDFFSI